ncbi:protein kinase [Streptomyces sp. NBC_01239]|uniref:serine/threonine-protein kinase n=1 Tax=Streptomyces sp. NBC_01239 TaxID=2903792 RepID=UPI00225A2184|nr:serine/threonine protein kinase [Streptomyces sp. NBC_01239]MCX4815379.1 protein kinase [Streptomyces sp. NBC_01239]
MDGVDRLLAGRYRVVARLGRGGMGVVWRAVDEVLGREVAVKELRTFTDAHGPELADLRLRMQREARAAARVRHPGVVAVHDIAEVDGRPLIVMELIDGPSLDDVLSERGPIDPREAAGIGAKVMEALAAAHAVGVLHRDVKPGNILLDRSGRVVLTDFGIATMDDPGDGSATHLTRSGELIGSLDYLAPERAQGADPGPSSDVWALGATLYAAVEGTSPFRRTSTYSTLTAIVSEPLPEPRRAGRLGPVLRQLMEKQAELRPDAGRARGMLETVARGAATDTPTAVLRGSYGVVGSGAFGVPLGGGVSAGAGSGEPEGLTGAGGAGLEGSARARDGESGADAGELAGAEEGSGAGAAAGMGVGAVGSAGQGVGGEGAAGRGAGTGGAAGKGSGSAASGARVGQGVGSAEASDSVEAGFNSAAPNSAGPSQQPRAQAAAAGSADGPRPEDAPAPGSPQNPWASAYQSETAAGSVAAAQHPGSSGEFGAAEWNPGAPGQPSSATPQAYSAPWSAAHPQGPGSTAPSPAVPQGFGPPIAPAPHTSAPTGPIGPATPPRRRARILIAAVASAVVLIGAGVAYALHNAHDNEADTRPSVASAPASAVSSPTGHTDSSHSGAPKPTGKNEEKTPDPAGTQGKHSEPTPSAPGSASAPVKPTAGTAGGSKGGSGSGGSTGSSSSPSPAAACQAIGGGKYNCQVWRSAKSYTASGTEVGVLGSGSNYFFCQQNLGRRETYGQWTNTWWAKTDDDSGNTNVYVSAVYLKGGDNDEPVPGLPVC